MPPKGSGSTDVLRAVDLALSGMDVREAWVQSGRPGGEQGLQNIRKRKRMAIAAREQQPKDMQPPAAAIALPANLVAPAPAPQKKQRANCETKACRLTPKQVDKLWAANQAAKRPFIEALKAASLQYSNDQSSGLGRGKDSATNPEALARMYNATLPPDGKQLEGWRIRHHVKDGWAGMSPPGKGPKHIVPACVVQLMSTHVSMSQLNGNEIKPKAARRNLIALVQGTDLEQHLTSEQQRAKFLKRMRREGMLVSASTVIVDNRRWMWLTYFNVSTYFDGLKYFLVSIGFAEDTPEIQPDGSTSELTFSDYMKRRLSVGDETHQRLSNVGDKSGSRATTLINPTLPRAGQRKVESQKHITAYVIVNGFDEVGPFTVIFDTSCDDEEDRQINLTWTAGLPRVNCQYGCDHVMTFEPVVLVTPKGGTSEDALEKILLQTLEPLYPDLAPNWVKDADDNIIGGPVCHRLDGGPGRTGTASLPMRMRMADKGLYLFPSGPQNCTAATQESTSPPHPTPPIPSHPIPSHPIPSHPAQEPDAIFGTYKKCCDDVTDDIVAERINARAAAETALRKLADATILAGTAPTRFDKTKLPKVELTNADLPRVVNGRPDDPMEKRPFSYSFSRELVHAGNVKVGVVPFTRNALNNPKVRRELEDGEDAVGSTPNRVAASHERNLVAARTLKLNTTAMEIDLPRRYHPVVAPPSDMETVVRKLADAKCTQSGMWINCGAVAFNGEAMLRAGCEVIRRDLDAKVTSAADKLATFVELKAAAQSIIDRMRDKQIVSYSDLGSGEPKALVRFYFTAKSEKGIAALSSVPKQVAFLDGLESDEFEELLLRDAPLNYKAAAEVESVANLMLGKISDSVQRTIDVRDQLGEAARCLAGAAAPASMPALTMDGGGSINAASAGFDTSVLSGDVLLDLRSPGDDLLGFESTDGGVLKGREIVYHFEEGWFRGRILKQASDAKVKSNSRICNYRVFFEADDELISQALYSEAYGWDASTPVDGWMLLSSTRATDVVGVGAPVTPMALMGPRADLGSLD